MKVDPIGKPKQRWHYFVTGDALGWGAVVYLDSSGVFMAFSDWGTYGYCWTAPGGTDVRQFFAHDIGRRLDYFVSKFSPGNVFDADASRDAIRKYIVKLRRAKGLDAEAAKGEWELAGRFDNEAECMAYWWKETKLPGDDIHHLPVYQRDPQAVAFCEHILPRLSAMIAAELAQEAHTDAAGAVA